jgi:murein DD-endopeptidase MepM/ murein hydrolase activator NlpD
MVPNRGGPVYQYRMKQLLVIGLFSAFSTLGAQAQVSAPAEAEPGAIVRLTVADTAEDRVVVVRGAMAGEPLRFLASDSGRFRAIGAVPVDASDSVRATLFATRRSGRVDTLVATVRVPHIEPPKEAPLAVSPTFTRPMDAKTQARIARENRLAREVGKRSHDRAPMWTREFRVPREAPVTSPFGTGRMFNGVVASRHLGVDYKGGVGAPVYAAYRGVVALVDTFFLAGRLIYLDHGGGVVTGYFHLTKPLVAKGDTVERGQQIGTVGATGRVTGPHLHWSARYGALTFNPTFLIGLPLEAYSARASGKP